MDHSESMPLALPAGTVLAGKYVISQALGQGGFGITYIAEDYKTKEKVAIKEFFPDTMVTRGPNNAISIHSGPAGENFVYGKDCFLEEAKTLAEFIGNENIVRVISYFEENGTAYFVMEYIEGESFQDYIKSQGGKVSWEDAVKFLIPVMDALAAVHSKGIVHRDVTPDNIYITKEGVVKLLDFGAARYSLGDKSRSLDVVLKHGFAPKEQYTRHGKQGPFTDVYTVGASFYYALTGKRPPDAIDRIEEDDLMPPTSLGVAITPAAEDAILKALNVQPAERFQDMLSFKNALLAVKENNQNENAAQAVREPAVAEPSAVQNHPVMPHKEKKTGKKVYIMAGCAAGVIVILLGTIIALLAGNNRNANSSMTVADHQSSADVAEQSVVANDNVITDSDDLTVAVAENSNVENTDTVEDTSAEEDVSEESAEEVSEEEEAKDDPYSYETLGYDYENEMEWESHQYYIYSASGMTWQEAFEAAESCGGYLARINSEQEMKHILGYLEDYAEDYRYIYIGGARNSKSSSKSIKKSYCWVDPELKFMKKQYIYGPKAEDEYSWLDDYWLPGEPTYKDGGEQEQVLEFIYRKTKGEWKLNDVSARFPNLDGVTTEQSKKIAYLIEFDE